MSSGTWRGAELRVGDSSSPSSHRRLGTNVSRVCSGARDEEGGAKESVRVRPAIDRTPTGPRVCERGKDDERPRVRRIARASLCARTGGGSGTTARRRVARCTGGGKVMVEAGACLAPRAGVACACQCGPYLEEVGAAFVAATAAVAAAAAIVAAIATDGRGDVRFQPFAATVAAAGIATAGIATSGSGVGSVVGSALGSGDGGDVGSGVASVVGTARGSAYGSVVGSGVGSAIGGDDREGGCAVRWRQRSRLRGSVGSACAVRCLCARLSLAVVARLSASVRCGRGGNADAHHQH